MTFLVFGFWTIHRTFRHWKRPYLEFKDDILVIFNEGKTEYVPRKQILSHLTKWNATILVMEDSHQFRISYGPFAWTQELKDFQNHFKQWMETGKNLD